MSVINKVFCDRCGGEIFFDRTILAAECGPLRSLVAPVDLCEGCGRAFLVWLSESRPGGGAPARTRPHDALPPGDFIYAHD